MSEVERLRSAKARSAEAGAGASAEYGEYGALIGGRWVRTGDAVEVRSPYDDALVAVVHRAGPREVESAIAGAVEGFQVTRKLPSWQREAVLLKVSQGIAARREEFARIIALEAGKPLRTARLEVDRAVYTFKIAAEETKRNYGEIVPLDWLPGNEGRIAHIRRVPLGPIVGITPFNFPLNLVAHKVAPAMAAGNPIIVRPASNTPLCSLKLGEIILEAGWPENGIFVVPCATTNASPLVDDDRIRALSFTGSPSVGWALKTRAGRKRVTLELGGNAGVIVHCDADLNYAAERITWGGYSYSGQSCISVQRVMVHQDIYEEFTDRLVSHIRALSVGDPLLETTDAGPLIDAGAAERVDSWIKQATARGAALLIGGERQGNVISPAALASVEADMKVSCQEVFGPVTTLTPYSNPVEALRAVDDSDYGLQAGLFTNDVRLIDQAFDMIDVGGLMINDVSTYRIDHMPYGGVKHSGMGREGLRYAIEEMTEMKLMAFNSRS